MKFYNQQHGFYCGIDLHANSMHVCVVDHSGNKHVHRNFDTKKTADFLAALQPFQNQDLIIGCESTFNWYWLGAVTDNFYSRPGKDNQPPFPGHRTASVGFFEIGLRFGRAPTDV